MLTKEQIQHRAHLVRVHEANCEIQFPNPDEANFRIAVMKQLGREFRLKELREAAIQGPVTKTEAGQPKRGRVWERVGPSEGGATRDVSVRGGKN